MRSATAPETMVAAAPANAHWKNQPSKPSEPWLATTSVAFPSASSTYETPALFMMDEQKMRSPWRPMKPPAVLP